MTYFETERLIFRNWHNADLAHYIELNRNFEVRRYFPDILSKERSERIFDIMYKEIERDKHGLFAVTLKDGTFIGFIGTLFAEYDASIPHSPFYEIGWRILPQFTGNGYATEGARGLLDYMRMLNIEDLYAYTSVNNIKSINVMKKIGMKYVTAFVDPHYPDEQILYRSVVNDLNQ
ncbi:GNAT family N-acetyltransferase [Macrococcus caseolyticus]|uniref:GNAT family N-acetyltransferase n=2 Tax=Macrococcoides caseolyticum TaxID=69966 RepID=A0ACC9MTA8_9STAP|nr:GNAT family N-acetyltransferase [Macrococcus caseolyticus]MDJ1090376.1 GNAT family N-acetyltransferase [Macrococcus caseolyticus]MDJ1154986.1 GNAT family N-acetyltransferase [Macrococcus caseolyticus]MEB8171602.1 GNAT family N-acetyltransferase [Macrococcus caseolyticus]PKE22164.1 GNAT family N-acetyltransferase [Macrococcus caseolyticus]PKE27240.1 GNAT family N-acetyltransferase [Macrococcus caseolyticus]